MNAEEKNQIYDKIQKSVKDKFNEDISIQEINSVCKGQFKIMVYGLTKSIPTQLPFIGTFVPVDYSYYKENLIEPNKLEQKELIEQGDKEGAIESMVNSIAKYKSLLREKKQGTTTADAVINAKPIGVIPEQVDIFKTFK